MKNSKIKKGLETLNGFNFLGIDSLRMAGMSKKVNGLNNLHRLVEVAISQESIATGNVSLNETFTIHTLDFLNVTIDLSTTGKKIIPLTEIISWIK